MVWYGIEPRLIGVVFSWGMGVLWYYVMDGWDGWVGWGWGVVD